MFFFVLPLCLCASVVNPLRSPLGVELHARVVGHVHPDVDVRLAAEVPDERRPLAPPVVPDAVLADVAVLVERQAALVEAAGPLQAGHRLVAVLRPERPEPQCPPPLPLPPPVA